MSLEQALAANTAALQALTAALAASATVLPHPAPTSAPFTAAVAPVPTVPEASTDSSPLPTAVFGQPAATIPLPAAPAAPPTASPAVAGSVEYDSKGMPWDGRIHASSKNKVADGSWRYKRNCDEATIAQIEAELRATMGAPAVAAGGAAPAFGPHPFFDGTAAVPPVPAAVPAAPAVVPVAPAPVVAPPPAASVAVPVAAAAGIAPAATPAAGVGLTYESLIAALPAKITSGELTATQLQEACEKFGVASIGSLAARPDLVPIIAATLGIQ